MSRAQLWICYIFLVAGLVVAVYSIWLKTTADGAYGRELVVLVDWHALNSLAGVGAEEGTDTLGEDRPPVRRLLDELDGASVCYGEETVGTLLDQGVFAPAWVESAAPAYTVMQRAHEHNIAAGAGRHGYRFEQGAATAGRLVVEFPSLPEEDLMLLPVAWLDTVIDTVHGWKVPLVLRPGGAEFLGENGLGNTLGFAAAQPLMLFQGPTVLGYPGRLDDVAGQLKGQDQVFGWVEFDEQDGGHELAARLSPRVVRVHSIPPEEMVNYDAAGAVARYTRAARERNIRCLYVRPFVRGSAALPLTSEGYRERLAEANRQYFQQLQRSLLSAGFRPTAEPPVPTDPPDWLTRIRPLFVTLAVGAVGTLLFAMWLTAWPRWVWWLLIALTALKAIAAVFVPVVDAAVLFAASLFFPLWGLWLAMLGYQRMVRDRPAWHPARLGAALLALVVASAFTVLGGLLIHGGMWDAAAMLKVSQFRGVTLALAVPLLVFAAYAWQGETLQDAYDSLTGRLSDYWQRLLALWQSSIRYGDVAFIFIALGAVAIVLLRSGNESPLEVLSVETWFREGLEQVFAVRPRTKELIGHPLLVVFFLSLPWRNRLTLLFGLAGLLGQVSILNTFCHLHTPLLVTGQRVLLGLGFGLLSGLLWGIVALLGARLWHRYRPVHGALPVSDLSDDAAE